MDTHDGVSLFYHPEDGQEWANYIRDKLDSKDCPMSIELNCIDEAARFRVSSKVNVVLLTPGCLEMRRWNWASQFDMTISIAVLAGINHEDLVGMVTNRKSVQVLDWLTYEVAATDESVRTLLVTIITMLERRDWAISNRNQSFPEFPEDDFCSDIDLPKTTRDETELSDYDKLPKHSRQVNRIYDAVSQSPHMKDDIIYVILERKHDSGVTPRVQLDTEEYLPLEHLKEKTVYTFPRPAESDVKEFNVLLDEEDIGLTPVPPPYSIHGNTVTETSPFTRSKSSSNMTLDNLRDLLSHLLDPVTVLRQALGIETDSQLDELMASMVRLPNFQFPDQVSSLITAPHKSGLHWPTPLHFGAAMNMKLFCSALLSNSLVHNACHIHNVDGLTPLELARSVGNEEVAEVLQTFEDNSALGAGEGRRDKDPHDSGYHGSSNQDSQEVTSGDIAEADKTGRHSAPEAELPQSPFPNIMSITHTETDKVSRIVTADQQNTVNVVEDRDSEAPETAEDPGEDRVADVVGQIPRSISVGQTTDGNSSSGVNRRRGFLDMFKRRPRSNSEPCLSLTEFNAQQLRQNKKGKQLRRKFSTDSGNTNSSCSNSSDGKAEELKKEAKIKGKEAKEMSGKKIGFFMKNAKNRKSVRIKNTMQSQQLSPPDIPSRKE